MTLSNEFLQVEISAKGAELKYIRGVADGYDYLWDGKPAYWAKTSPVLFPIVGALKDDTYHYKGQAYRLSRHGFARDRVFEAQRLSDTEAVFTLTDTMETRANYPFSFELALRYQLIGRRLRCTYIVHNPSNSETLLFAIGGHPAFAVPTAKQQLSYSDYYLDFPNDNELRCHMLDGNLISEEVETVLLEGHRLQLQHELFYDDALVIKTLKSHKISLRNCRNDRGIHFRHEDFPFFGIWAAKDADFVCLEPWFGIADSVNHNQRLEEKEGIQTLPAGATWRRTWEVECF